MQYVGQRDINKETKAFASVLGKKILQHVFSSIFCSSALVPKHTYTIWRRGGGAEVSWRPCTAESSYTLHGNDCFQNLQAIRWGKEGSSNRDTGGASFESIMLLRRRDFRIAICFHFPSME